MKGRKQEGRRNGPRKTDLVMYKQPSQLKSLGIPVSGVRRFVTTGTVQLAIAFNNLLDSFLVATSPTAGFQLFDMVKINSIEMWGYSPSGTTSLSVSYVGKALGATGDGIIHEATSIGAFPCYLKAVPSKMTTAADYQAMNTNVAFNMYCPAATVVDINLSFKNAMEGGAPQAVAQALVSAQPGNVYYRGIDGQPLASTKFTPQGTPDII